MTKRITGVDAAARVFRRLPRAAAEKIVGALEKGAEDIADRARVLVPRDEGDLSETITTRVQERRDGRAVIALVLAGTTSQTAITAYRQEFGRAPGPGENPGHADQAFLFPAYWAVRRRVRGRVARAVNAAAKTEARRR
ncbi:MAG: HK97 gp10 family phage protein [Pseudomonadota bacterium]